jgi:acyl carrier protein
VEVLQLVAAIEEEFELTIDDDELVPDHFRSMGNLITFIERRL